MNKTILTLTNNCKFYLGDCQNAWQSWFNDSDWEDVSLPHDWSVTLPFKREYSSGTGYLAGGIGWYRLRIKPDKNWIGKRISILFDGIYKNSKVWCNSYYLGARPNGYIPISYDITDQFRFDRDNLICIQADHRDISDSRWFTGSGITRKVTLIIEEPVHLLPDGISFTTEMVEADQASFTIKNEIINTEAAKMSITLTNKLLLEHECFYAEISDTIGADSQKILITNGTIPLPKLWSPNQPSLYTLETWIHLKQPDGTAFDYLADSRKVGIRSILFDPDLGFFLNGHQTVLKGVCVHHDAGCLGAAVHPAVWYRRLKKLKAMGCNALRMSHNPHMPELYDLCDSMGFFVIDEAFDEWEGPKNKWSTGHNVYPPKHEGYYLDFPTWHEQDLTALIRRDRHHPCVILWSIGNEIDYPNDPYCHSSFDTMTGNNDANKPSAERVYNPERPDASRLAVIAKQLTKIVKGIDTTRPVTLAAAFPELSAKLGFLDSLDVVGYNYKEHLYEESHLAFPDKPFMGSENSHSIAAWRAVTDNPYISGQFLWTGIDYLGEAQGWPIHGSGAGLLTLAGFEKPWYYRRQSFWSEKPVIHLSTAFAEREEGEWTYVYDSWNYPAGEEILIKCYTNLREVSFYLNEELICVKQKEANKDCISFSVPFRPGTLSATGKAEDGSVHTHMLKTSGSACQIQLKSWDYNSLACWETPLFQVEATLTDHLGNEVLTGFSALKVSIENGRLLGLENGDLSDVTDYSASSRNTYMGHLIIYAVPDDVTKETVITVGGDTLKTASLILSDSLVQNEVN
ncbi:glycoside hydrolase family 2 TIM barrel-domain containing protein [Anaerocolumna sp. AGMB13025]|uniref:glycoside hydrolase family 2 TIM barrel-domain containing protein n=1 Tax=Anaerocolumna sp. AGMB13025 TaxID=3039116 RepID=UPI00241FAED1|nr:glycoside hydrolase family 2 TIM barrel-domain containing protein [Anaerocolumna sp. AGMB13025]WFR55233.1 glycoside hydrolase family 2 TIM barrel-domain containing protein [Anaerocolumna sp. AGMB13025]